MLIYGIRAMLIYEELASSQMWFFSILYKILFIKFEILLIDCGLRFKSVSIEDLVEKASGKCQLNNKVDL